MTIDVGNVVYCNQHWGDRNGFFVVESPANQPGMFNCRRIMKPDGTIIMKSKLRPIFDVKNMQLMTQDAMQSRYEANVKRAIAQEQAELNHLLSNIK